MFKYSAPEVREQADQSRMGRASAHAASSRNGRTGIEIGSLCALSRNQKRGRSLTCIACLCSVCLFFPTIGQLGGIAWFSQHFRYSLAQAAKWGQRLVAVAAFEHCFQVPRFPVSREPALHWDASSWWMAPASNRSVGPGMIGVCIQPTICVQVVSYRCM